MSPTSFPAPRQPVAPVCFFGGLPGWEQVRVELAGVGWQLRFQSPGEHLIDGVRLDAGELDRLIDRQAGNDDVIQNQVRLTPLTRPTAWMMLASVTACRI